MNDKQKQMGIWLVDRIMFAMDQGDLTEQQCMDAVTEAEKKLYTIKEVRSRG